MNKRVVIVLLVLVMSVGGLFAEPYAGPLPAAVTATLTSMIDDFMYHGFIDSSTPSEFDSQKTITDAFGTDPSFRYGYRTNIGGSYNFLFLMTVSDFINDADDDAVIKIADVVVGASSPDPVEGAYTILSRSAGEFSGDVAVVIKPAKADGFDHLGAKLEDSEYVNGPDQIAGAYTSTVTIVVKAV